MTTPPATAGIDELHDELFPDRPAGAGTRYERLAALVLQLLNPEATIVHDQVLPAAPPDRSSHQIDVIVDIPGAGRQRILIECRHYQAPIEKRAAMAHWAVAEQLGAHAVMVTTKGYRVGAKTYAEDKGMTLLELRTFRPEDTEGRLMSVTVDVNYSLRTGPEVTLELADAGEEQRLIDEGLRPPLTVSEANLMWEDEWFTDATGTRLEPVIEGLQLRGASMEVGETRIVFDEPRCVDYYGKPVSISGLVWSVKEHDISQRIVAGPGLGEPRLLIADAVGAGLNRAIFERPLAQLAIASNGQVVERVRLPFVEEQIRAEACR
jgi:hypothetical protein